MMRHPLSNLQMAHFLIYFLYIIGMQIEKLASSLVWRFKSSILYPKKKRVYGVVWKCQNRKFFHYKTDIKVKNLKLLKVYRKSTLTFMWKTDMEGSFVNSMPCNWWTAMVSSQYERSQPFFAPMVYMDERVFIRK